MFSISPYPKVPNSAVITVCVDDPSVSLPLRSTQEEVCRCWVENKSEFFGLFKNIIFILFVRTLTPSKLFLPNINQVPNEKRLAD